MRSRSIKTALAALTALFAVPAASQERAAAPPLGLMGTIPIYWGEADGLDDLIGGRAEPHWARMQLEADFALRPLDYLSAAAHAGLDYLLLAQPRALSGEETVAPSDSPTPASDPLADAGVGPDLPAEPGPDGPPITDALQVD